MALPDLLIAHHITANRAISTISASGRSIRDNARNRRAIAALLAAGACARESQQRGQPTSTVHLIRYEKDPGLQSRYREWMADLWEMNWIGQRAVHLHDGRFASGTTSRREEALRLRTRTLRLYPPTA